MGKLLAVIALALCLSSCAFLARNPQLEEDAVKDGEQLFEDIEHRHTSGCRSFRHTV
jgi:hypothetical protein